jgi:hypothetical protein
MGLSASIHAGGDEPAQTIPAARSPQPDESARRYATASYSATTRPVDNLAAAVLTTALAVVAVHGHAHDRARGPVHGRALGTRAPSTVAEVFEQLHGEPAYTTCC